MGTIGIKNTISMNDQSPDFENMPSITLGVVPADWDPGSYDGSGWRLSATSAKSIRGIVAPSGGIKKTYWIINDGDFSISLQHNSGDASVGNRFSNPDHLTYIIRRKAMVMISYDPTRSAWVVVGDGKH